jgi:hypothetical protein
VVARCLVLSWKSALAAAARMKVRDYCVQGHRSSMCLHKNDGKEHKVSCCHYNLEKYLDEYITAAGSLQTACLILTC